VDESTPRRYTPEEVTSLHAAMVDAIVAAKPFDNPLVEQALRAVPRHLFLPKNDIAEVYSDAAIPTAWNDQQIPVSSSTQPSLMGLMIDQLDLRPGHRVLEIGAATGYNAAVLRHIVGETGRVVTIDIDEELVATARGNLSAAGYGDVIAVSGDGALGFAAEAPYDRILVTVGCPDIPPAWPEQLADDGVLVVPLALIGNYQKSLALVRRDGYLESRSSIDCRFVSLRGEHGDDSHDGVAIGDVPGQVLHPELDSPESMDADAIERLLQERSSEHPLGVSVGPREAALRLLPHIALHVPHTFWLVASEAALAHATWPELFSHPGVQRVAYGARAGEGLALLVRRPGSTVDDGTDKEKFVLDVRSYGASDAAEALVATIREWDAAGRATGGDLQVRIWPAGAEVEAAAGDLVIRKPSSIIVVSDLGGGASKTS
jgi:protein-L-isoaspartate(D-aspartate) O-methyltransferase